MTDLTVKYFSSGMTGAPQIANNWGDLVTMLDACLINGFALKAIDTLTFADGIATATFSSGHAYQPFQVIEIAGAEQTEYNGQFRVLTATMNCVYIYNVDVIELPGSTLAPELPAVDLRWLPTVRGRVRSF